MKMEKRNPKRRYHVSQAAIIFLVLTFIIVGINGCTYKTYSGDIGDATFSFQYRENDCVNPPDPYSGGESDPPEPIPEGC